MIFLSEKFGKVYIGYKNRWANDFYDNDYKLKNIYQSLKDKIANNSEFKSFFRDNFLSTAQKISEPNCRYTETLKSCVHIMELSEIDFELFKNKFSFEEFRSSCFVLNNLNC